MKTLTLLLGTALAALLFCALILFRKGARNANWHEKVSEKVNRAWARLTAEPPALEDKTIAEDRAILEEKLFEIPGVDTRQGLALLGWEEGLYRSVLRSYVESAPTLLDTLRGVTEDTLKDYAIHMHSFKGASASIGAEGIGEKAAVLESMAKAGDADGVLAGNAAFLKEADSIVKECRNWLNRSGGKEQQRGG
ncbi:MAG: Hpt domain-containing protein [Firmicutes bacterium]|nr:Hpt domain-containing protein [Bacillota bacterium]